MLCATHYITFRRLRRLASLCLSTLLAVSRFLSPQTKVTPISLPALLSRFFFFLMIGRPPRSTLFPSPPLFRSVFDPPPPPLDSTLAVGGAPSARSILRVVLPRAIRDSSQIIRATLILVPAVPVKGAPSDSFVVEAHTVLADFGAKSPLVLDATRTDTTFVRVGATDTVRIEVTNLLQFWTSDSTRPEG